LPSPHRLQVFQNELLLACCFKSPSTLKITKVIACRHLCQIVHTINEKPIRLAFEPKASNQYFSGREFNWIRKDLFDISEVDIRINLNSYSKIQLTVK
jgi:hypothetical protein